MQERLLVEHVKLYVRLANSPREPTSFAVRKPSISERLLNVLPVELASSAN